MQIEKNETVKSIERRLNTVQSLLDGYLTEKEIITNSIYEATKVEIHDGEDLTDMKIDYLDDLKTCMREINNLKDRRAKLKEEKRALTTCEHCGRHS